MDGIDGIGDLLGGLADALGALIELAVRIVFWIVECIVWLFSKATAARMKVRRFEKSHQSKLKLERAKARLSKFRRAKAKRIARWIKIGVASLGVIALWWTIKTDRSESAIQPNSGERGAENSGPTASKSNRQFSFSGRKTDTEKPVTDSPETEKTKSRWKLPFTKREKTEEPSTEKPDDTK
jgi:hypothetical protein